MSMKMVEMDVLNILKISIDNWLTKPVQISFFHIMKATDFKIQLWNRTSVLIKIFNDVFTYVNMLL